jgi:hypothetical protein
MAIGRRLNVCLFRLPPARCGTAFRSSRNRATRAPTGEAVQSRLVHRFTDQARLSAPSTLDGGHALAAGEEEISTVPTIAVPAGAMVRVDPAWTPTITIPVITSLAHSIAACLGIAGQDGSDRQDRRDGGEQSEPAHGNSSSKRASRDYNSSGTARDPCAKSTRACRAVRQKPM